MDSLNKFFKMKKKIIYITEMPWIEEINVFKLEKTTISKFRKKLKVLKKNNANNSLFNKHCVYAIIVDDAENIINSFSDLMKDFKHKKMNDNSNINSNKNLFKIYLNDMIDIIEKIIYKDIDISNYIFLNYHAFKKDSLTRISFPKLIEFEKLY